MFYRKPLIQLEQPAERVNLIFFDPEKHWCKICSIFPKTAKEYLIHMHSEEHKNNAKPPEIPWHDHVVNDEMPSYPNAPTKRTPIRGLQFFMPSTAWFCKLCAFWIGDLHCASAHLKSVTHAAKYDEFIGKNPNFETEWLEERRTALEVSKEKAAAKQSIYEPMKENIIVPPPPPAVSLVKPVPPPHSSAVAAMPFAPNTAVFDGIPLKIAQRTKENSISEDSSKKSKKRKKDKKKRKKSKRKHRRSSSTSSTSSSSSSEEESSNSSSEHRSSEHQSSPEKPVAVDTSASIRVAMRNAGAPPPPLPPKDGDTKSQNGGDTVSNTGGWMVVQEQKIIAPQAPTISANGEAQNRRDEVMISQWSAPVQPVISDQEKLLLSQLKDKLKGREESKKEKTPQPIVRDEKPKEASTAVEKRDNDDKRRVEKDRERDKDRRDTYRRRRTRSRSVSPSRRDR